MAQTKVSNNQTPASITTDDDELTEASFVKVLNSFLVEFFLLKRRRPSGLSPVLVLAASHFSLKTGHLGYSAAQLSSRMVWAAFLLGVAVRRGAPRVGEELGGGAAGAAGASGALEGERVRKSRGAPPPYLSACAWLLVLPESSVTQI